MPSGGTFESVSQARLASLAGGIPDLAADLVEGVAGPTHHMEWVSALDGVGATLIDHAHDPGGPVPAHPPDPATALVPQGIEGPGQGGPVPARLSPDQVAGVVVEDHGQVALPLAVADLVDPDPLEVGKEVAPSLLAAHHQGDDGRPHCAS